MKLLQYSKAFQVLLFANLLLLPIHIAVQFKSHDVNWLRLGDRSSLASHCIRLEGLLTMLLVLAIFEQFYPDMGKMVRSKEMKWYAGLFCIQIVVWCVYRETFPLEATSREQAPQKRGYNQLRPGSAVALRLNETNAR